jgi:hypothetical protein
MEACDWLASFPLDQKGVFVLYFQLNSRVQDFLQGHVEYRGFYYEHVYKKYKFLLICGQLDAPFWFVMSVNKVYAQESTETFHIHNTF